MPNWRRAWSIGAVVLGLAALLALAPTLVARGMEAATLVAYQRAPLCFPETGKCVRGAFHIFWEQRGGLEVFGYPVSDEIVERNAPPPAGDGQEHLVQYFERARFEYHVDPGRYQGNVKLGLLGREQWAARSAAGAPPPVTPAPVTDLFEFCARAGIVDYPIWLYHGPFEYTGSPPRDPRSGAAAGVRCLGGQVLMCLPGATDWICRKANPDPTPRLTAQLYCQIKGEDGVIPAAYSDRASFYTWVCRGGQAVIERQVRQESDLDERGYLKETWSVMPRP